MYRNYIVPQAYFSRNALRIGAAFPPVVRVYQFILSPLAKPTSILLDRWLGPEAVPYFRERDLREVIRLHAHAEETDLDFVEAIGALNFLALDDLSVVQEGEPVDARSVIPVPAAANLPVLPTFHPAYLLRAYTPENRKKVWSDLQMAMERMGRS